MKFKRLSSALVSATVVCLGGIGASIVSFVAPNQPAVQAQSMRPVQTLRGCFLDAPFAATIAFNPTNIRSATNTTATIVGRFTQIGQVVQFSGITTGQAVPDAWDGVQDNMWYRLADGRGWVAGAVVKGYPQRASNCVTPSGKAEAFFRWAPGQVGIARHNSAPGLNGQCVSLAVRYLQDVFLTPAQFYRTYGHGKDVARGVASQHSNLFQFRTSGTPKRGAIISFAGGHYGTQHGHVGVVMETRGNEIRILESNYDGRGASSVTRVSPWINRSLVVGWADPINPLP